MNKNFKDYNYWWFVNIQTAIYDCSNELSEMCGVESGAFSQHDFMMTVNPEHRERVSRGLDMFYTNNTFQENFQILTRFGYRWVTSYVDMLQNDTNGNTVVCGHLQFMTESEVHKEENSKMYENMPVGYLRVKLLYDDSGVAYDYKFIEVNQTAKSINNFIDGDIVGTSGSDWQPGYKESTKLFVELLESRRIHRERIEGRDDYPSLECTLYAAGEHEIIILIQDLTASIETSNALHRSKERLDNIYNNIPVGIEIYDKNGFLISINDIEQEMFGYSSKEDILGVNLFENPNIPSSFLEDLKNDRPSFCDFFCDFEKIKGYYESQFTGRKHIVLKGTILYDANNNVENYLLILLDNTDILEANNKIREFEELFNSIADFSEVGLSLWGEEGNKLLSTDQWYQNFRTQSDDINNIMDCYVNAHPEDKARIKSSIDKIFTGEINAFREEIRISDGDNLKWLRVNYKTTEVAPGEGIEVVGICIDITEIKNTELKLLEAKHKAEESDRLKSAFLANMSHEIRTPLNAIVGFSDLLMNCDDNDEREQYMKIIRQSNDLLLQLITDILDLSKIESGIVDVTKESFNVNDLCGEIVCTQSVKAKSGVEVLFENRIDQCVVVSDRNRISQVLINLTGNALKFTAEGKIAVGYDICDGNIQFYVRDTGFGISAEQCANVFDRFVKLNDFIPGTGLGLSICKSLIAKLGGKIWVESKLGEGSCFYFTIPYINETNNIKPEQEGVDVVDVKQNSDIKPTLLIAEDTDSNYLLLSAILRRDYNLVRAINGRLAVEMHSEVKPDLIFMDIKMPEMDGLEATRLIRQQDKKVPIVMLTAFAYNQDRECAEEAGCSGFMTKPVSLVKLKEVLAEFLN